MAEITIKLNESIFANKFSDGELVHAKAFEKIKGLIGSRLKSAQEYEVPDENAEIARHYDTISVFGERGVGKTSFLLSLRNHVECEIEEIAVLPIIDPTLIEEKAHVLLLIISLIENQVDRSKKTSNDRKRWQNLKDKLAKGLPTLKAEGMTYNEPKWYEDEYIMEAELEGVKHAYNLERNFHELVREALSLIGKKAFLVMFDDTDIDFHHGWAVLETIRKYLTSPQLIVVMSGNMKLYSKNIRKQQWHNFGKELLRNEMDGNQEAHREYTRLVNELEGQYILKILKSENRIFLHTLEEYTRQGDDKYLVKFDDSDTTREIGAAYAEVFQQYGVKGREAVALFTSFMERTSMRTQIHFLYNHYSGNAPSGTDLVGAFTSRMYAEGVDVDLAASLREFLPQAVRYIVARGIVDEGSLLLPTFEDTDTNSVMTGLSLLFASLSKHSCHLPFDYWLRLCLLRRNMRWLTYDDTKPEAVSRYLRTTGAMQANSLRTATCSAMAFVASVAKATQPEAAVALRGYAWKAKKGDNDRRIDEVLRQRGGKEQVLGYLPVVSLSHATKNESQLYYSATAMLAAVGTLLAPSPNADMAGRLREVCQPIDYRIANEAQAVVAATQESRTVNFNTQALTDIAEAFNTWKGTWSAQYAPYLYGRIAARFFTSLPNIVDGNRGKGLGDIFSLMVMSLMNASLVEEARCSDIQGLAGLNINNVVTTSDVLKANIRFVNEKDISLPFTKWIAACPLLYPFINLPDETEVKQYVADCCGSNMLDVSLSAVLNGIATLSPRSLKPFSTRDDEIANTISAINDAGLDIDTILSDRTKAANEELKKVFSESISAARLRPKCEKDPMTGLLRLKQQP